MDIESIKTMHMKFLEYKYRAPIEDLILDGGVREVASFLGVDPATITKWRRKLAK